MFVGFTMIRLRPLRIRRDCIPFLWSVALASSLLLCDLSADALDSGETHLSDETIGSLAQFGRLYGYVRFFHPSDEAAAIDWDRFAVLGAREMLACKSPDENRETLERLFRPVAPTMVL
jgi:hypothetical protein